MKLGFSTLGCPGWTIEHAVTAAREIGYDGIELRLLDSEIITPDLLVASQERIKRAFADSGVELAALGTSARFSSSDVAERRRNETTTRAFIDVARVLGAPVIRVFGGTLPEGVSLEQAVENVSESLNRLAPAAEDARVALALETHDDFSKAATVAAVLDRVASPAIGALWDIHPPHELGESTARVWELLAGRVKHTHIKDARPGSGPQWDLLLLGEGVVPAREVVELLAANHYEGYLAVEWEKKWQPHLAEPEVAFPQYFRELSRYRVKA